MASKLLHLLATLPFAFSAAPLSLHSVVQVSAGGEVAITLQGYDSDIGTSVSGAPGELVVGM